MERQLLQLSIEEIKLGQQTNSGFRPVVLQTDRGDIAGRYYHAPEAVNGVIYVGGVGGGFDSPAKDLYPKLAQDLQLRKTSGLRIKYRTATDLVESILDVVASIVFLKSIGIENIALVGHSFGGAVVIQAAAATESVNAIATLATQAYGTEAVATLSGKSLLFIHGTDDEILPSHCSSYAYELAQEPKDIILLDGSGHGLDEAADDVYEILRSWLLQNL
jgi:dienelactone hydrolase